VSSSSTYILIPALILPPGWDSSFEYEGQTYAEMPKEEKNKISHRGKALDKLKAWLKENTE
jgi:inosine triphosphate pyrophosphatase